VTWAVGGGKVFALVSAAIEGAGAAAGRPPLTWATIFASSSASEQSEQTLQVTNSA
jgi:hypothetical protein